MIKSFLKILAVATFGLLFSFSNVLAAAATINSFNLRPGTITTTGPTTQFQMTLRVGMNVSEYNSRCGSNDNDFTWYVYREVSGPDINVASGDVTINRTSTTLTFNLDRTITVDTSDPNMFLGGRAQFYAQINCTYLTKLTESARVPITFGSATNRSWACVAADNRYACSPANLSNCSDVSACAGRQCIQVGTNVCGQSAANSGSGGGNTTNTGGGTGIGTGGSGTGTSQPLNFTIDNPLGSNGPDTIFEVINIVTRWILQLSIPIAVIAILWAGFLFMTSAGNVGKVQKARDVLWWTVVGLAIIFIGRGFITLIYSIIQLGGEETTQTQSRSQNQSSQNTSQNPDGKDRGGSCPNGLSDCRTGLVCNNRMCTDPGGNRALYPCRTRQDCRNGLTCDTSPERLTQVEGENLGTCIDPQN